MTFGIQEVISPYSLREISFFKHSLDAEIDLREEESKIQGLRCLKSVITRNTLECFTSSKNMCIYRLNWASPLDLALHLQSTA